MKADLIERLQLWATRGKLLQPYEVKPMMREAANTIAALQARVEKLEEALRHVADGRLGDQAWSHARAALSNAGTKEAGE